MNAHIMWIVLAAGATLGPRVPAQTERPATELTKNANLERPEGVKVASAGWWADAFDARAATLTVLRAEPESYRGMPVRFTVQFRELTSLKNSWFTRFEPENWVCLAAWPDEAPLWEKKAFERDCRTLFVKRGSRIESRLKGLSTYRRLVVTGTLCDVIKGEPWIEVTAISELGPHVTEPALVRIVKGLMLRDLRRYDAAAQEFAAADAETLPLNVRLFELKEGALCLFDADRGPEAEKKLLTALRLKPDDPGLAAALARVRIAAGKSPGLRPEDLKPPTDAPASRPSRKTLAIPVDDR